MSRCRREVKKTAAEGLTLIETVIAIMLVAILVGGVYSGITLASNMTYATGLHLAAFTRCRESLELMRAAAYDDVNSTNFVAQTILLAHMQGEKRLPLQAARTYAINELEDPTRKEVTVTVSWLFKDRVLNEEVTGVIYFKP